jgi:hypothetical protein
MTQRLLASFFLVLTVLTLGAEQPPTAKTPIVKARNIIKGFYASPNPVKRQMVINCLGIAAQDRGSADLLTQALNQDKDPKIRINAASAMAEGQCRSCIPALKHTLDDKDIVVAFAAAKALWDLGDRSGLPLFEEVLSGERKDTEGMIHGALLYAHRTMHDPSALALLGVNETAGMLFGPAGTALSFAEQGRKMSGGTAGRVIAAGFVGLDKSHGAQVLLEKMLSDKDGSVVAASCKALALRGGRANLATIEPLLDDSRDGVLAMSAAAVIRLTAVNPVTHRSAIPKQ